MLVNQLHKNFSQQLQASAQLPVECRYSFDISTDSLPVRKTLKRAVVSLNLSSFQAREVVREERKTNQTITHRCAELAAIVPSGCRYAYDMIAFVGKRSYLEGHKLKEIREEIINRGVVSHMALSSIYELQRKFLFYLGKVHEQAASELKAYLHQRGNITWLIDATIEPGTPVYFGVKEACEGIFLGGWKIPTENEKDISRCLSEAAELFGVPEQILHDLSERMSRSCEIALPSVAHRVCHYHLLRDLGHDLYQSPHEMLSKRLRALKLQLHLKDQRSRQTQWLKRAMEDKEISLILTDLLNGKLANYQFNDAFGREVLLALHLWMLDYPRDGHRQGFPFDPYLLYFHHRIVTVYEATERILSNEALQAKMPKPFVGFAHQLKKYLMDPIIVEAAELYEKAFDIFEKIRQVLRLGANGNSPMHDSYDLHGKEQKEVKKALSELCNQFDENSRNCTDPREKNCYEIALSHLEKYGPYLFPAENQTTSEQKIVRSTNGIESHWSQGKRARRQTHGRRKLTRDFHALPAEYMLIPNLKNQRYVELVLGSLDNLTEKIAEAGKIAGPYSHWYKRQKPLHIGRLPVRLLKKENFVEDLIDLCNSQCEN